MKYLINANSKAIRTGEFVEANKDENEFILDTDQPIEDSGVTLSSLRDIATTNKIEFTSRANKADLFAIVAEGLSKLNLKQVNKMTETAIAEEIVKKGFDEGKTEDDMVVELIESGIGFKAAGRIFQTVAQSLGLMVSAKERSEKAQALLDEIAPSEFDDYEAVGELIAKVMEEVPATDPKQAMTQIRKYCNLNEIEIPKKTKAASSGGGGIRSVMFAWMIENPAATQEEFAEFMASIERSEATTKHYWGVFETAQQMAAVLSNQNQNQKAA